MEPVDHFVDRAGRRVEIGDYVVYPYSYADMLDLRFGIVLAIKYGNTNEYTSQKSWGIHVRAVADFCGEPELCKVRGVLRYPNRILKANDVISEAYKELLAEAK